MNRTIRILASAIAALSFSAGIALAQMATPAPTATSKVEKTMKTMKTKSAKTAKAVKARTDVSLACSAEANSKGLKGKPRRTYRKSCMAAKKKAM